MNLRLLTFVALALLAAIPAQAAKPKMRLVLQITVDQLRGDFVERFGDRFGKGGFRYFLDNGVHYNNAHYTHANTETAPGHATLATGAPPAYHGIVGNDWLDRNTGTSIYNTSDDRHHILGEEPRPNKGVSPRNLKGSTFSDELIMSNAGESRSFSVSVKDRGAILAGGHAGKAFWFSTRQGTFVTSTYYYDEYPQWVSDWRSLRLADEYMGQDWELVLDHDSYAAADADDRPFESSPVGIGTTFPHRLDADAPARFYNLLRLTPMGDELTLQFVKALIDAEEIGQSQNVDYLQISFSSPDYAGHFFGPSSLEYEDAVLRLDGVLEELFRHINKKIGLYRTLIVLSADHGGPEIPEHAAALGIDAGRFPLDWFSNSNPLSKLLTARYGRDDLIVGHQHPYLYLNVHAIDEIDAEVAEVERFVAEQLTLTPGIALAVPTTDLMNGRIPDMPIQRMIRQNFDPERSGHVHLVQDQYWFLHSNQGIRNLGIEQLPAVHGSPWRYDTYVPIMFVGPGISRRAVNRRVAPRDVAPTLSAWFGIKPPSGSTGEPLEEILR
ncbi:MAG: alkaline phosphatase family protein [Gammaproteobacteria bacterium]|nr:alkaline phosphatase family protein [Gammaproteobacteria bacterium]MBT8445019.1 alkaline phosphatase family protein [Gammaproteobacteria bacterium]NND35725.1 alkaline phosphatase family protein [Gammaproteobacteria bacterium]